MNIVLIVIMVIMVIFVPGILREFLGKGRAKNARQSQGRRLAGRGRRVP